MADPATEEMVNDEEYQALRAEVAAEIENEESGKPIAERSEAEEEPEEIPEKEPEKEAQKDPWEGVNPALKNMFENLSSQITTLGKNQEERMKQAEHRIGAITNELHTAKTAKPKDAPTEEQIAEAAKSEELWKSLQEDFPEWGEAIDGRLKALDHGEDIKALRTEIAEIKSASPKDDGEVEKKIATAILSYAHKDWRDVVQSEDYLNWLKTQPADVVTKANNSWNADDAISVLDSYKESKTSNKSAAEIAASRSARLKNSVSLKGRQSDKPKSEDDMTDQELRSKIAKEVWAE